MIIALAHSNNREAQPKPILPYMKELDLLKESTKADSVNNRGSIQFTTKLSIMNIFSLHLQMDVKHYHCYLFLILFHRIMISREALNKDANAKFSWRDTDLPIIK